MKKKEAITAVPRSHSETKSDDTNSHLAFPSHLSVLIVDDQPVIRKMVRHRFKTLCVNLNWKLHEVSTGEEMLNFMENKQADIVVIDNNMESAGGVLKGKLMFSVVVALD
jgi:response regulator RpfG family c-di-GMP phosphodiesterase